MSEKPYPDSSINTDSDIKVPMEKPIGPQFRKSKSKFKLSAFIICVVACATVGMAGAIFDDAKHYHVGLVVNWLPRLVSELIGLPEWAGRWVLPYLYWIALGVKIGWRRRRPWRAIGKVLLANAAVPIIGFIGYSVFNGLSGIKSGGKPKKK